jgi:hypothetical protein
MTYKLEYRAFIYEGGIYDDTCDFCKERNGQVFTIREAEEWKNLEWPEKNEGYNPLRDMGGRDCRHFPSYISDELAVVMRPELKDKLDFPGVLVDIG